MLWAICLWPTEGLMPHPSREILLLKMVHMYCTSYSTAGQRVGRRRIQAFYAAWQWTVCTQELWTQGKAFLGVVDAHSKWLEVSIVPSMSSCAVVKMLQSLFATQGILDVLVSDSGTAFTYAEFKDFAQRNGIRHVTTAPYNSPWDGQVERMVQTTKDALRMIVIGDWQTHLARFLLAQHITLNSMTGKSPAQMLVGCWLTTALDWLHPDCQDEVRGKQEKQSFNQDRAQRQFQLNYSVFARSCTDVRWVPAVVETVWWPDWEFSKNGYRASWGHILQSWSWVVVWKLGNVMKYSSKIMYSTTLKLTFLDELHFEMQHLNFQINIVVHPEVI